MLRVGEAEPSAKLTPTRDHVVPRSAGGTAILVVCERCNLEKADMPPDEFLNLRHGCLRTLARLAMISALRKELGYEHRD